MFTVFISLACYDYNVINQWQPHIGEFKEVIIMARPRRQVKYSEIEIEQLIRNSDNALYNALISLYQYQLEDEQLREVSMYRNNKGFAKADAKMLTVMSKMLQEHGTLSFDNVQKLRAKLVRRYVRQITRIANYNWDTEQVTLI